MKEQESELTEIRDHEISKLLISAVTDPLSMKDMFAELKKRFAHNRDQVDQCLQQTVTDILTENMSELLKSGPGQLSQTMRELRDLLGEDIGTSALTDKLRTLNDDHPWFYEICHELAYTSHSLVYLLTKLGLFDESNHNISISEKQERIHWFQKIQEEISKIRDKLLEEDADDNPEIPPNDFYVDEELYDAYDKEFGGLST